MKILDQVWLFVSTKKVTTNPCSLNHLAKWASLNPAKPGNLLSKTFRVRPVNHIFHFDVLAARICHGFSQGDQPWQDKNLAAVIRPRRSTGAA